MEEGGGGGEGGEIAVPGWRWVKSNGIWRLPIDKEVINKYRM